MARHETATGGREATKSVIPGRFALSVGRPNLQQPQGFQWTKLTDVSRLESGHTPSRGKVDYWDGDIPWVGIRDATGNHGLTINATEQYITEAGLANSSARLLPAGTVCLSRTASVGFVVTMGVDMATSQDFVNWVCGPELSSRYLRYILVGEQESVRRFAHGTTHQTMYYPEAKALHVLLPDRPEQDAIAEVLGALDDKIAANTRLVATADALAASLTRPTLDMTRHITLNEIALVTMGSSPPGTSYNEAGDGTVFYQGVRDFGMRYPANRVWTTEPVRMARPGDCLLTVRAPVGQLNLSGEDTCIGRGLASVRSRSATPMTLFHLLRDDPEVWAPFEAEGTIFGSINKTQLEGLRLPTVTEELAEGLEQRLSALEASIASCLNENVNLAGIRDVLLPALMSGKIRVKHVELMVGDVV